MIIVETSVFTRQVQKLLTDDEYRQLQATLVKRPNLGAIIVGSGGIRKARWAARGHGKSGGVRVIYYWATMQGQLLMLLMYAKGDQENLSPSQIQILKKIVEEEYP
ncbi:MAG: type II toxin-antitoxin system RelE/ParE family toxin [Anaerolineae bacterium]|nr:type II toxin-antitoxin system RelE/ParE family toxin [Anaerolineae bacterium]